LSLLSSKSSAGLDVSATDVRYTRPLDQGELEASLGEGGGLTTQPEWPQLRLDWCAQHQVGTPVARLKEPLPAACPDPGHIPATTWRLLLAVPTTLREAAINNVCGHWPAWMLPSWPPASSVSDSSNTSYKHWNNTDDQQGRQPKGRTNGKILLRWTGQSAPSPFTGTETGEWSQGNKRLPVQPSALHPVL